LFPPVGCKSFKFVAQDLGQVNAMTSRQLLHRALDAAEFPFVIRRPVITEVAKVIAQ
jgi:hypothetical protein